MIPFRRLLYPIVVAVLASACLSLDNRIEIPDNATIYRIDPPLLGYLSIDTSASSRGGILQTWLSSQAFVGYNCLALVPTSAQDTTGQFVFVFDGPNTGLVEVLDLDGGTTDTTIGYFLPLADAPQGTHGTYAVDSSGRLKLFWADGSQSRYFAPTADIRLFGDTIRSYADNRTKADSVRRQWTVYWTFDEVC